MASLVCCRSLPRLYVCRQASNQGRYKALNSSNALLSPTRFNESRPAGSCCQVCSPVRDGSAAMVLSALWRASRPYDLKGVVGAASLWRPGLLSRLMSSQKQEQAPAELQRGPPILLHYFPVQGSAEPIRSVSAIRSQLVPLRRALHSAWAFKYAWHARLIMTKFIVLSEIAGMHTVDVEPQKRQRVL